MGKLISYKRYFVNIQFFGDGIPINENILAIKNGYNNYKTSNEKKIKELSGEKQERTAIIEGLSHKI